MSYVIIGLSVLAVLHFIYDGILAPSFRLELRYELFALRDELRRLKITHGSELDDKHFHYLQDSINSLLGGALSRIDICTLAAIEQEIQRDRELKKRTDRRVQVLDDCRVPEAIAIRKKSVQVGVRALGTNSGGWVFYIVPVALVVAGVFGVPAKIKRALSMSEPDLRRVIPVSVEQEVVV